MKKKLTYKILILLFLSIMFKCTIEKPVEPNKNDTEQNNIDQNKNIIAQVDSIIGGTVYNVESYLGAKLSKTLKISYKVGNGAKYKSINVTPLDKTKDFNVKIAEGVLKKGNGDINIIVESKNAVNEIGDTQIKFIFLNTEFTINIKITKKQAEIENIKNNTFELKFKTGEEINKTLTVNYTKGNGGEYISVSQSSTGKTNGITATINKGTLANGNGSFEVSVQGNTGYNPGNAKINLDFLGKKINIIIVIEKNPPSISELEIDENDKNIVFYTNDNVKKIIYVNYKGGNNGDYNSAYFYSTGITTSIIAKLEKGTLTKGDGTFIIKLSVKTGSSTGKGKITLNILNQQEVIHFTIKSKTPKSPKISYIDNKKDYSYTYDVDKQISEQILIKYNGGNGVRYESVSKSFTKIPGITARIERGVLNNGNGSFNIKLEGYTGSTAVNSEKIELHFLDQIFTFTIKVKNDNGGGDDKGNGNGTNPAITDPYDLVDGKMPIFDDLFKNLKTNPHLEQYFSEQDYNNFFPNRGKYFIPADAPVRGTNGFSNVTGPQFAKPKIGKQYYSYENFKAAVNFLYTKGGIFAKLFNEGSPEDIKREIACILAHVQQETAGLAYNVEIGYHPVKDTYGYHGYHGRGPKQLSYDYNYKVFSEFVFNDKNVLLIGGKYNYNGKDYVIGPGAIAEDGRLAWLSGLHFLLKPNSKPSMHDVIINKWKPSDKDKAKGRVPGFGMTINIINGGVEGCGSGNNSIQAENRIKYYNQMLTKLNVTDNREKSCKDMAHY